MLACTVVLLSCQIKHVRFSEILKCWLIFDFFYSDRVVEILEGSFRCTKFAYFFKKHLPLAIFIIVFSGCRCAVLFFCFEFDLLSGTAGNFAVIRHHAEAVEMS